MPKDISYYLSKGFDERCAQYFASGRRTPQSVRPQKDFTLLLRFDNGETRVYDMKPLIKPGTVFSFLSSYEAFSRVYLDSAHAVCWDKDPNVNSDVVWENKVDICPDTCYLDSLPAKESSYV